MVVHTALDATLQWMQLLQWKIESMCQNFVSKNQMDVLKNTTTKSILLLYNASSMFCTLQI